MIFLRYWIIAGVFCLASCSVFSPKPEFIPVRGELNAASVGNYYFSKIEIIGGRVIDGWYRQERDYRPGVVTPANAGINIRNCRLPDKENGKTLSKEPLFNGNCVEIYGTPTKPGKIKITLRGGVYGNMFVPAGHFSKEYTLNVVAPSK